MASKDIHYNCGCEFSTTKLEEALEHADSTGHSLTIVGSIKAPRAVKDAKKAAKDATVAAARAGTRKTTRKPTAPVEEPAPLYASTVFSDMRARLNGGAK